MNAVIRYTEIKDCQGKKHRAKNGTRLSRFVDWSCHLEALQADLKTGLCARVGLFAKRLSGRIRFECLAKIAITLKTLN